MTVERKQEIINQYRRDEKDTGSSEVQIALLTERINEKFIKKTIIQEEECLKWLVKEEIY